MTPVACIVLVVNDENPTRKTVVVDASASITVGRGNVLLTAPVGKFTVKVETWPVSTLGIDAVVVLIPVEYVVTTVLAAGEYIPTPVTLHIPAVNEIEARLVDVDAVRDASVAGIVEQIVCPTLPAEAAVFDVTPTIFGWLIVG